MAEKPTLIATSKPQLIDLKEELEIAGVDVPTIPEDSFPQKEAVFLPYQQAWFEDESDIMLAEKSRRTGLTWAESGRNVITASKPKRRSGRNTFYVGSKKEMALEYIAACALFARAFNLIAKADVYEQTFWDSEKKEEILTYMIRFPKSGFKIQALSSKPSNLRGLQGDVVIDEAAFHDDLEELLKAALALTMWGSKVRLISTHNGQENKFNELIEQVRAGKLDYSIHRITLEDAVNQGLYKRICYVTGKDWTPESDQEWLDKEYAKYPNKELADEELGCIPRHGSGVYIPRSYRERAAVLPNQVVTYTGTAVFNGLPERLRELEMHEWLELEVKPLLDALPKNLRHTLGEDFARNGDLTVFAPCTVHTNTKRSFPFLVELSNVPFKQQEQAFYYIADRLPRRDGIKLDARGNGQYLAEQAAYKYGAEVEQVMLSTAYYRENMPRFKAAFEDDELQIPKNEDVINDFSAIQIIRGVPSIDDSRTKGANGQTRHGDSAIAIFLAYIASKDECRRYELHRIKPDASKGEDEHDIKRQMRITRGFKNMKGGLL